MSDRNVEVLSLQLMHREPHKKISLDNALALLKALRRDVLPKQEGM